MGGLVKGIGKVFKAVGSFVKKYWKVIVIAAAIYFTAGMAAGAMAPAAAATTDGAIGAIDAGAAYSGVATGIAAGADAGSMATTLGISTAADYAAGTAAGGAAFEAAGGVAAAGLGAADVASATMAGGEVAGAAEGGGFGGEIGTSQGLEGITSPMTDYSGLDEFGNGPGVLGSGSDINSAVYSGGAGGDASIGTKIASLASKGTDAAKGFWGGMSTGEKLMFASTAFSAISGALKQPTRAQEGLWPGGAFFGADANGNTTDLAAVYKAGVTGADQQPATATTPPATAATQANPTPAPGAMQQGGTLSTTGAMGPTPPPSNNDTQANGLPTAAAASATGSDFLPAAGSGAANAQRSTMRSTQNLAEAQTRNEKFFNDLRDRLDASHPS